MEERFYHECVSLQNGQKGAVLGRPDLGRNLRYYPGIGLPLTCEICPTGGAKHDGDSISEAVAVKPVLKIKEQLFSTLFRILLTNVTELS